MDVKTFGAAPIRVSPLGLGLAALGRPGYINLGHADDLKRDYAVDVMEGHAHEVLDTAWGAGIRYFDAARSYGRAEAFLGSWLQARQIPQSDVVIGSKWGYTYTADWQVTADKHEIKEHTLPVLQRQWGETQANLKGYLRLYQIHSATLDSNVLDNQEVLGELARLRSEGILIGLSLSGASQAEVLRKAMAVQVDGVHLFNAVQATWNLLEPSSGEVLREAHEAGMRVVVKEALANGRLTIRNTDPLFAPKMLLLREQADRLNTTIDALALAAVLAQPWATIVLSGAATVEQLQSNVRALDVRWDEEAADRLAALAEPVEQYWKTRSGLAWN